MGDLELEITNTGQKPIYEVSILLIVPDNTDPNGLETGYDLRYGRIELVSLTEPLRPDDVPIRPGESAVIKLPEIHIKNWKKGRTKGNKVNPKKLSLWVQGLNFGDGTGFGPWGTQSRMIRSNPQARRVGLTKEVPNSAVQHQSHHLNLHNLI
jgi:hypothetical protein